MKKWLIGIVAVLVIGYVGYRIGMNYISDKVMDKIQDQLVTPQEIEEMKKDPEIQDLIKSTFTEEEVKKLLPDADIPASSSGSTEATTKPTEASTPSSTDSAPASAAKTDVMTRQEAEDLVMSKFSLGELKNMADKAKNGLTKEEKAEIKAKLEAKMTAEEIESLKKTALIEILKKDANTN